MRKNTAIFAIILTVLVILTFALVACNKTDTVVATFEFEENDGIADFSLRRGVVLKHKVDELNKIDGVEASLDGTQITVLNGKAHMDDVRKALDSEPTLSFKTENSASAPTVFYGKDNIKSITLSINNSIEIEFTASGVDVIGNYYNRQLYLYLGDELITTLKPMVLGSNTTATIIPANTSDPVSAKLLAAQLNAGTFGLKVKSKNIK